MARGRDGTVATIAPDDMPTLTVAVDGTGCNVGPTIGVRITRARRARRMTQEMLAGEIGCDRSAIARWEAGSRMPRLSHLLTLSRVLRCAPAALLPDGVISEEEAAAPWVARPQRTASLPGERGAEVTADVGYREHGREESA